MIGLKIFFKLKTPSPGDFPPGSHGRFSSRMSRMAPHSDPFIASSRAPPRPRFFTGDRHVSSWHHSRQSFGLGLAFSRALSLQRFTPAFALYWRRLASAPTLPSALGSNALGFSAVTLPATLASSTPAVLSARAGAAPAVCSSPLSWCRASCAFDFLRIGFPSCTGRPRMVKVLERQVRRLLLTVLPHSF